VTQGNGSQPARAGEMPAYRLTDDLEVLQALRSCPLMLDSNPASHPWGRSKALGTVCNRRRRDFDYPRLHSGSISGSTPGKVATYRN